MKSSKIAFLLILVYGLLSCHNGEKKEEKSVKVKPKDKSVAMEESLYQQGLVNIKSVDSTIKVDLKYSTLDNFFGRDVYGDFSAAFLQVEPAKGLKNAQSILKAINPTYSLLIYDAARPRSIQRILWNALDTIPPKRRTDFVADPNIGSIHNYGCAVDITIYDLSASKAIDMGTKYDHFGNEAYPRLEKEMLKTGKITQLQIQNRELLRRVMMQAKYEPISSEWWHFNFYPRKIAAQKYKIIE